MIVFIWTKCGRRVRNFKKMPNFHLADDDDHVFVQHASDLNLPVNTTGVLKIEIEPNTK